MLGGLFGVGGMYDYSGMLGEQFVGFFCSVGVPNIAKSKIINPHTHDSTSMHTYTSDTRESLIVHAALFFLSRLL